MLPSIIKWIGQIKRAHPQFFDTVQVLECGSLDINGSPRSLFALCIYTGIDIYNGPGVDIVTSVHNFFLFDRYIDYSQDRKNYLWVEYDVILCLEMLEHDRTWRDDLIYMMKMLKNGGLFICSFATQSRAEHGTTEHTPEDSPGTNDWYEAPLIDEVIEIVRPYLYSYVWSDNKDETVLFHGIRK
jgi:hypothetical protein